MKNVFLLGLLSLLIFNACEPYKQASDWVDENSEPDNLNPIQSTIIGNIDSEPLDSIDLSSAVLHCVISNPSFEANPRAHSITPSNWKNCGDMYESPPDIQPGFFQVNQKAEDGDNYLGLIVREAPTNEAIGQKLENPLEAGKRYVISFDVARSYNYISMSKSTMKEENFNEPAILRVKLGRSCSDAKVIAQTNPIVKTDWVEYTVIFEPTQKSDFLVLEAFFKDADGFTYNGNVLLDNISPIYEIPVEN